jgi:hypothetical protein
MKMTSQNDPALLAAAPNIGTSGPAARLWEVCKTIERAANPSADARVLTALIGRRVVMMTYAVLLQELTRKPGAFTEQVAALANGLVFEIGEQLQSFPFEERVRAFEGLSAQLAAGMQIGLAAAEPEGEA